jgi:DNA-binding MarR family transcriptional regulator
MRSVEHAGHLVDNRFDAALAPFGLSIAKLGVLRVLVRAEEPLPLSQVAEQLACVKSNITQLIDRLEADGLVQRISDLGDRRSKLAMVTDAGRRLFAEGTKVEAQMDKELFQDLSEEERGQLKALLGRFSARSVRDAGV